MKLFRIYFSSNTSINSFQLPGTQSRPTSTGHISDGHRQHSMVFTESDTAEAGRPSSNSTKTLEPKDGYSRTPLSGSVDSRTNSDNCCSNVENNGSNEVSVDIECKKNSIKEEPASASSACEDRDCLPKQRPNFDPVEAGEISSHRASLDSSSNSHSKSLAVSAKSPRHDQHSNSTPDNFPNSSLYSLSHQQLLENMAYLGNQQAGASHAHLYNPAFLYPGLVGGSGIFSSPPGPSPTTRLLGPISAGFPFPFQFPPLPLLASSPPGPSSLSTSSTAYRSYRSDSESLKPGPSALPFYLSFKQQQQPVTPFMNSDIPSVHDSRQHRSAFSREASGTSRLPSHPSVDRYNQYGPGPTTVTPPGAVAAAAAAKAAADAAAAAAAAAAAVTAGRMSLLSHSSNNPSDAESTKHHEQLLRCPGPSSSEVFEISPNCNHTDSSSKKHRSEMNSSKQHPHFREDLNCPIKVKARELPPSSNRLKLEQPVSPSSDDKGEISEAQLSRPQNKTRADKSELFSDKDSYRSLSKRSEHALESHCGHFISRKSQSPQLSLVKSRDDTKSQSKDRINHVSSSIKSNNSVEYKPLKKSFDISSLIKKENDRPFSEVCEEKKPTVETKSSQSPSQRYTRFSNEVNAGITEDHQFFKSPPYHRRNMVSSAEDNHSQRHDHETYYGEQQQQLLLTHPSLHQHHHFHHHFYRHQLLLAEDNAEQSKPSPTDLGGRKASPLRAKTVSTSNLRADDPPSPTGTGESEYLRNPKTLLVSAAFDKTNTVHSSREPGMSNPLTSVPLPPSKTIPDQIKSSNSSSPDRYLSSRGLVYPNSGLQVEGRMTSSDGLENMKMMLRGLKSPNS